MIPHLDKTFDMAYNINAVNDYRIQWRTELSMSVSLKDIAREAGVYPPLVSAVLNDRNYTRISQARRAEIKAIAKRMGFRPNLQASCLRKGEKSFVGVFLPMREDVLIVELIRGLSHAANQLEIPLSYYFGMEPESYGKFLNDTLKLRNTAIITCSPSEENITEFPIIRKHLTRYMEKGGKVISISTSSSQIPNTVSLDFDDAYGGKLAARYLASRSCRSYATFSYGLKLAALRCPTFRDELAGFFPDVSVRNYAVDCLMPHSAWLSLIDRLFEENPLPVGIFVAKGGDFCNYILTRGLERGLRPEKDFILAAYDRPLRYGDCYPIARIIQPYYELGVLAVKKFDELRSGHQAVSEQLLPELFLPPAEN